VPWCYAGIGGTIVLIVMWVITRISDNPIMGRTDPTNAMGVSIEVLQGAFIGLTTSIIACEVMMRRLDKKTTAD